MQGNFKRAATMLAAILAITAVLSSAPSAIAQRTRPSSVLPSGGGQSLLDPSDTVILLPIIKPACSRL